VRKEEQILPLERGRWCLQIEYWHDVRIDDLRHESARRARAQTWETAAVTTARLLDELAHRG
jgi:hypothetical protein